MNHTDILNNILTPEFDYNILISELSELKYPRNKISSMIKSGSIVKVKKGIYVKGGETFDKFVLSSMICGPSYVSEDSALSFYGLIPEGVETTTCITSGRNRSFETQVGEFTFHKVNQSYYSFGITRQEVDENRAYLIATPEKALFDRLIGVKGIDKQELMDEYLFENMRFDESGAKLLKLNELRKIRKLGNLKFIDLLINSIEGRR